MPCPCGASNEPMTLPFLSMWIIAGGRTQQSASGGVSSASSSISVKSLGRFSTHTLSSLSTANPVTPPSFHLFGRGLGQSGSYLNLGTVCALRYTHTASKPSPSFITGTSYRFYRSAAHLVLHVESVLLVLH